MRKILVLGGVCALLLAVVFVVLRPSYDEASKDYRAGVLSDLARRAGRYRDATGNWPASLEAMAPPVCRGQECVLTSDELGRVESSKVVEGAVCIGTECIDLQGVDAGVMRLPFTPF